MQQQCLVPSIEKLSIFLDFKHWTLLKWHSTMTSTVTRRLKAPQKDKKQRCDQGKQKCCLSKTKIQKNAPVEVKGCDLEVRLHDGHDRCLTQHEREGTAGRGLFRQQTPPVTSPRSPLTWWKRGGIAPSGRSLSKTVKCKTLLSTPSKAPAVTVAPKGPLGPLGLSWCLLQQSTLPLGTDRHHLLSTTIGILDKISFALVQIWVKLLDIIIPAW